MEPIILYFISFLYIGIDWLNDKLESLKNRVGYAGILVHIAQYTIMFCNVMVLLVSGGICFILLKLRWNFWKDKTECMFFIPDENIADPKSAIDWLSEMKEYSFKIFPICQFPENLFDNIFFISSGSLPSPRPDETYCMLIVFTSLEEAVTWKLRN